MASILRKFISTRTPKFFFLKKAFNNKRFTLLDIGSGNHSPSKTTDLFPGCEYYGVDLNEDYNYNEKDLKALKAFYAMDLTKLEFGKIQDNFYDFVMMSHIIEHLHNGDKVLELLSKKIKKDGYIYIEFPGQKSTTLPSMVGTLNFHDDPTHVRVYSYKEVGDLLSKLGFKVVSSGMRKSWYYILTLPLTIIAHKLRGKQITGPYYWDLMGFAEYVYAQKVK